jgi:PHD/YefM family antitoxin component YafN of YafNO toxin-antitoxin module
MSRLPQFIIDAQGRKKSVLLPITQYKRMMDELEDLRDALELEKRIETSTDLIPYDKVRSRLIKRGKL